MGSDRSNSHSKLLDSSSVISLVIFIVSVFSVFLTFYAIFSILLFECFEPDPGFLGINNKYFKAFCTLARYHYIEIC